MNTTPEVSRLCSATGQQAQLHAVHVHLKVLGLMLRITVRQTWCNPLDQAWSGRWHFPLGAEQTLLILTDGKGQAMAPVERDSRTMCHTAIEMPPCGSVTLQWRCAQLLALQGGSLRLLLPAAPTPAGSACATSTA